jgi:ubiquitin carboxyl-terminal hydrolase 4/11/15
VDFPLSGLDLSTRVAYWTDCEIPIYDCFAVSNHYGGLGGGHYTAHALNDDGVWCYYDDSRVTINVDPKEVVTEAAYLLYYRRRDVPIGEKFVVMLQTVPDSRDPSPIVIHDQERALDLDDISSTNAAKVDDEDGLEVDDMSVNHDDVTSRTASPMGSVDCIGFHSMDDEVNHAYREKRGEFGESSDTFPRQ